MALATSSSAAPLSVASICDSLGAEERRRGVWTTAMAASVWDLYDLAEFGRMIMGAITTSRRPFALVASLTASLVLGGCVSRGSYDAVVEERDQLRRLSVAVESNAADLGNQLMLRTLQVSQLEREQQELADEVARWAVRGAIQMQLLADGLHLVLSHDVLFTSGTTTLSNKGRALIVELVQEINQQPYQIAVLGYSDNVPVGPELAERYPSNWELAGARAASVVRVMEEEGVPANQLVAISRGETEPVASNDTVDGRSKNRRIDVRIRPVVR
jgi:chemotaxis protein MotB